MIAARTFALGELEQVRMYVRIITSRGVFSYNDSGKALRKIGMLQRNNILFTLTDALDRPLDLAALERSVGGGI